MTQTKSGFGKLALLLVCLVVNFGTNSFAKDRSITQELPPHALPPREVQLAFQSAESGDPRSAIISLLPKARVSLEFRLYAGLLLLKWREQLIVENANPVPPVEWGVNLLRCGTFSKDASEIRLAAALLSELYQSRSMEITTKDGKKVQIPGPGKSTVIATCWSHASEGIVPSRECRRKEELWRERNGGSAKKLVCPPLEPTPHDLEKFRNVPLVPK